MLYKYNVSYCLKNESLARGVSEEAQEQLKLRLQQAVADIKANLNHSEKNLPVIKSAFRLDDIDTIRALAGRIRDNYTDLVVIGTGGSATNPCALVDLVSPHKRGVKFHFISNVDPGSLEYYKETLPLETTAFLVISKSGGTLETLSVMSLFINEVAAKLGEAAIKNHFFYVTGQQDSILRRLAAKHLIMTIDHDDIGGRFSALTTVGLIAAAVAGLDPHAFRHGAKQVVQDLVELPVGESQVTNASIISYALLQNQFPILVTMPYRDQLESLAVWHRQTWAESLGKKGVNTTAIKALGTIDQHSQLQLYLDGPKDKQFLFIRHETAGLGPEINSSFINDKDTDYLKHLRFGDVLMAEQQATMESLYRNGCPVKELYLPKLDEATIGAVLMHLMLEIILVGYLLEINPYDQPAVEESKMITRSILKERELA